MMKEGKTTLKTEMMMGPDRSIELDRSIDRLNLLFFGVSFRFRVSGVSYYFPHPGKRNKLDACVPGEMGPILDES